MSKVSFVLFGTVSQCYDATSILDGIIVINIPSIPCHYADEVNLWMEGDLRRFLKSHPEISFSVEAAPPTDFLLHCSIS